MIGSIPDSLTGSDYLAALKDIESAGGDLVPIHLPAPPAAKRRRVVVDTDIDGGDDDLVVAPLALEGGAVAPVALEDDDIDGGGDSSNNGSSNSSSSSSGSSSSDSSVTGDEAFRYPKFICGRRVRKEQHARSKDAGLRMSCPTHGALCRKFRGLTVDTHIFGPAAPCLFLECWCHHATDDGMTLERHHAWNPTRAQVRAWAER